MLEEWDIHNCHDSLQELLCALAVSWNCCNAEILCNIFKQPAITNEAPRLLCCHYSNNYMVGFRTGTLVAGLHVQCDTACHLTHDTRNCLQLPCSSETNVIATSAGFQKPIFFKKPNPLVLGVLGFIGFLDFCIWMSSWEDCWLI